MLIVETDAGFLLGGRAFLLDADNERAWAEPHLRVDPDISYMLGNYVEADNANDNGHIFPLEDLEANRHTLLHKPLNMLHHGRYVVGSFVAQELLMPEPTKADAQFPVMEALAAFWRHNFPDEYELVKKAHGDGTLFFCVDEETELLTAAGWRRHDQLVVGDSVYTLDTATNLGRFTPLQAVNVFPVADEPLVRMEGMMHSSLTTLNHRWWVQRKQSRASRSAAGWEWRTSDNLTSLTWIPRAVPRGDYPDTPKYSDDFVELVAWFWTEGTIDHGSVIYQSPVANPDNCRDIERCLIALFGAPGRVKDGGLWYGTDHSIDGRLMRYFHLCREVTVALESAAPGTVPAGEFLASLTRAQLDLFIRVSLRGDGTVAKTDGQISLSQSADNEKGVAQARSFEMACALAGIPTNTSRQRSQNGSSWHVTLVRRSSLINPVREANRGRGFVREVVPHTGIVWCPTTVDGTFLARRRGTVYWTGNSMEAIPESVACADPGCGVVAKYIGPRDPLWCKHMAAPGGRKKLLSPRFNAGAVIIPPVRPGWKRADISQLSELLKDSAHVAAQIHGQVEAEMPELNPRQWEWVMAQLLEQAKELAT